MTWMPAQRFGLKDRGAIRPGCYADLVLFDAERILDTATFTHSQRPSQGIEAVWVNGTHTYGTHGATGHRNGRFLPREQTSWIQ
jgi:N-acyl-D-aspartate/D-glutamate deacylase